MNIIRIETINSTNSYLKELVLKQTLEEGTVVVANNQTAGRGQRGNFWESQAGKNITCSMIFYPTFLPVDRIFLLLEAVSLGVKETLEVFTSEITIKWPNDIYYRDKKIAGILIENEFSGNTCSYSVAGTGININQEIFVSDAPNPVSLKQITGKEQDLDFFLKILIEKIMFRYEQLKAGEFETITKLYQDSLCRKN